MSLMGFIHKSSTMAGVSVFAGLDHWTGLLDWTTGLIEIVPKLVPRHNTGVRYLEQVASSAAARLEGRSYVARW